MCKNWITHVWYTNFQIIGSKIANELAYNSSEIPTTWSRYTKEIRCYLNGLAYITTGSQITREKNMSKTTSFWTLKCTVKPLICISLRIFGKVLFILFLCTILQTVKKRGKTKSSTAFCSFKWLCFEIILKKAGTTK